MASATPAYVMPSTKRCATAARCCGGSARTASHSGPAPSRDSSTGSLRDPDRAPAPPFESGPRRVDRLVRGDREHPRREGCPRPAVGYARSADRNVSWKQSSASPGPEARRRNRYTSGPVFLEERPGTAGSRFVAHHGGTTAGRRRETRDRAPSNGRPRVGARRRSGAGTRPRASRSARRAVASTSGSERSGGKRRGAARLEVAGDPLQVRGQARPGRVRRRTPRSPCGASAPRVKHTPWSITQMSPSASSRQWPDLRSALFGDDVEGRDRREVVAGASSPQREEVLVGVASMNSWSEPGPCGPSRSTVGGIARPAERARDSRYAATSRRQSVPSGKSHSGASPAPGLVDREHRASALADLRQERGVRRVGHQAERLQPPSPRSGALLQGQQPTVLVVTGPAGRHSSSRCGGRSSPGRHGPRDPSAGRRSGTSAGPAARDLRAVAGEREHLLARRPEPDVPARARRRRSRSSPRLRRSERLSSSVVLLGLVVLVVVLVVVVVRPGSAPRPRAGSGHGPRCS